MDFEKSIRDFKVWGAATVVVFLVGLSATLATSAQEVPEAVPAGGWSGSACGAGFGTAPGVECQVEAWRIGPVNDRQRGFVRLPMPSGKWIAQDCELGIDWIPENHFVHLALFWREKPGDKGRDWKFLCRRWYSSHADPGGVVATGSSVAGRLPWNEQGTVWRWDIPDRRIEGGQLFIRFSIVDARGNPAPGVSMGKVFGGLYGRKVGGPH